MLEKSMYERLKCQRRSDEIWLNIMTKKEALNLFSNTLNDFWGETPTPKKIKEAWADFLDCFSILLLTV